MRPIIFTVMFFLCAVLAPPSAFAQYDLKNERVQEHLILKRYIQNKYLYQKRLIEVLEYYNGRPGTYPIYKLIEPYIRGEFYDPFGEKTIDELYELAYIADSADDPDTSARAAEDFKTVLKWHYPNYTILRKAIPLVRENAALGDAKLLQWMQNLLVQRLLKSGNGQVLNTAYQIFSLEEENLILSHHNVKVINTEVINNGREYYHIHLVEDRETGKPFKIYTRLSEVMQRIFDLKKEKNPNYTYPLGLPDNFE